MVWTPESAGALVAGGGASVTASVVGVTLRLVAAVSVGDTALPLMLLTVKVKVM
jgi:hypothetical protein